MEFEDHNNSELMYKGEDKDYGMLSGRYASIVNKAEM